MSDHTQERLPGTDLPEVAEIRPRRAESASKSPAPPGDCLWGCRGTIRCLCGQGELSDDPLWIENE